MLVISSYIILPCIRKIKKAILQRMVPLINRSSFASLIAGLATNQIQAPVEPDLQIRKKTCLFSAHDFAVLKKECQKSFLF